MSGETVQVWLDDCMGRTTPATVIVDNGETVTVRMNGREWIVRYSDHYGAYRIVRPV